MFISFDKVFKTYAQNNKKIDYKYIKKLADTFCIQNRLDKINVSIRPVNTKECLAYYNSITRTMFVDINKCYAVLNSDNMTLNNFMINTVLIHELYHHKQNKMMLDINDKYSEILFDSFNIPSNIYNTNHDVVPNEHHANACSYYDQVNNGIRLGIFNEQLYNQFVTSTFDSILNGYEFIDGILYSPIEIYYKLLNSKEKYHLIQTSMPNDLKTRVLRGYPIDRYEYEAMDEVVSQKILVLNIDNYLNKVNNGEL